MSQQHVFRQQFGFASGQISKRSEHKGGHQWFDPPQNMFLVASTAHRWIHQRCYKHTLGTTDHLTIDRLEQGRPSFNPTWIRSSFTAPSMCFPRRISQQVQL